MTTFGVGELSALNGIAGSYAEYVPVLHIVGAPCLTAQQRGDVMHHTLGDGDFRHFAHMSAHLCVASARLTADNACAEIDRVLTLMMRERRPGYLMLPGDVAALPAVAPENVITSAPPQVSDALCEAFRDCARQKLAQGTNIALLADFLALRFGLQDALQQWVQETPFPHATLLMGKGLFDETAPGFVGTYSGAASEPRVRACIEEADVVICVGVKFTDTITAGFSQQLPEQRTIEIQPHATRIGDRWFSEFPAATALAIVRQLCKPRLQAVPDRLAPPESPQPASGALCQTSFWR